jgi:hypothetical protein
MGYKYIYPTEKFNVKLDLEVEVKYVGVWDGMGTSFLQNRYNEMVQDGSFVEILKQSIMKDLEGETFDMNIAEPFDRLCFEVTENKLGDKQ